MLKDSYSRQGDWGSTEYYVSYKDFFDPDYPSKKKAELDNIIAKIKSEEKADEEQNRLRLEEQKKQLIV